MSPVDRDLVEEQREAQRRHDAAIAAEPSRRAGGMDDGTKRLALIAGGLGALLVTVVGGWSLLGHRPPGIPVIEPPPGPVRVKPVDPGGMQVMGTQVAQTNGPAAMALVPGPEEAAPQALQAEVDAARHADVPASKPVVPTVQQPAPAAAAPVAAAPTPAVQPTTDTPDTPPSTPPVTARPEPAVPSSGAHMVQLAALDSEAAAHAEWARVSKLAPSLVDHHAPTIVRVTRDGRWFYRLRVGGFASLADSTAFCGRAKAQGIACTPADF